MPTELLHGKSALVTGGARRIGREIALALGQGRSRCRHHLPHLPVRGRSKPFARSKPSDAAPWRSNAMSALKPQCVRQSPPPSHASDGSTSWSTTPPSSIPPPLNNISLEQWDAVFETNTRGPFLVAREAIPHLRAAHGRIVNIGSLGGIRAWAGHAHYCASKAALHMLTQAMAKAFAPEVSVNCVAPGWIEFDQIDRTSSPADDARRFAARTPMQRNGTADDVAQAVLFFATGPSFVTGQILTVDGGLGPQLSGQLVSDLCRAQHQPRKKPIPESLCAGLGCRFAVAPAAFRVAPRIELQRHLLHQSQAARLLRPLGALRPPPSGLVTHSRRAVSSPACSGHIVIGILQMRRTPRHAMRIRGKKVDPVAIQHFVRQGLLPSCRSAHTGRWRSPGPGIPSRIHSASNSGSFCTAGYRSGCVTISV